MQQPPLEHGMVSTHHYHMNSVGLYRLGQPCYRELMRRVAAEYPRQPHDVSTHLFLHAPRWDMQAGCLEDAFMKELYPKMPVIQMRAILSEKEDHRGVYRCPVYKQTERATPGYHTPGSGYVFMMQLKTKQPAAKWVMAGVAMLLATD